jgi:hypothetical protein
MLQLGHCTLFGIFGWDLEKLNLRVNRKYRFYQKSLWRRQKN